MGRGRKRKGGVKRGRPDEWTADSRTPTTLTNEAFERYYRRHVVPEEDWEAFMASLRTVLPSAIRININCEDPLGIRDLVADHLGKVLPTSEIVFYPQHLAMQSTAGRGDIKRNSAFKLQKRLIAALNEGGYLTRQEAVSMIPPLALNVQPGHTVLDLCAAPGSKTSQILERVVRGAGGGCVVANDVNNSRLDVLNHQTNRVPQAQSHLIITNNDALTFPLFSSPDDKFDRVLCDVMCSGDGTLRKSMDLWARWNAVQGGDLHPSQIRALTRGMMLCKKGGVVVYSTCSMNPLEDEAVLQHCLKASAGSFKLISVANLLPGLKFCPGRTAWTVTSKDLQEEYSKYEEAEAANERRGGKGFRYRPSMFCDSAYLEAANIHFSMRVLPHLQDTGGFFIAALECVDDFPNSLAPGKSEGNSAAAGMIQISEELGNIVKRVMSLPENFPAERLFVRGESVREQKVYYATHTTSQKLKTLVSSGCKIDQVGAKVFETFVRHANDKLRFSADGCTSLVGLLPEKYSVYLTPVQLFEVAGGNTTNLIKMLAEHQTPRPCFIARCDLGAPLGTIVCPGLALEGGHVDIKILEWQKTLLHFSLGKPIVDESAPAAAAVGEDESSGSDDMAEEDDDEKKSKGQ